MFDRFVESNRKYVEHFRPLPSTEKDRVEMKSLTQVLKQLEERCKEKLMKIKDEKTELEKTKGKQLQCNENEIEKNSDLKDKIKSINSSVNEEKLKELSLRNEVKETRENLDLLKSKKEQQESQLLSVHEAHVAAITKYKKNLNLHILVDKENPEILTVSFFQTTFNKSENYTVKLSCVDNYWKVLSIKPLLSKQEELIKHLEETQNIPGFILCIEELFRRVKDSVTIV